ncbi:MAG: alpha/beta hydrolase [Hyphomicrobiales bacterium]|nr:alpha/beta hydrolase [Hyphomicrobiales bacterium]
MKPGIVFLHGIGGCGDTWQAQIEHFGGRFNVLAWSAPGFGGKPALDDLNFANLASKLAEDMRAAGIAKAMIVGHSFGGMVAQQFVKDFSDMVSALVLVGTSPAFGNPAGDFQRQFVADRTRPLDEGKSMAELAAAAIPNLLGPDAIPAAAAIATSAMAKVPEQTYRDVVQLLTTFDLRENLANITAPALLVAGEMDRLSPPAMMEKMASYIPGAGFEMLPGIGHMTQIEDPVRFNALIDKFIGETSDG